MRVDELRHFLELVKQENVTRAAEVLHLTQPALSRSLSRLETELGTELFDRDGRRLRVNRIGELFVPHAARVVSEIDDAQNRIQAMRAPDRGVVSIAFVTTFGSWLVPRLLKSYRELFPAVRFLLFGAPADTVVDAVRKGHADIGFLSPAPSDTDLEWSELTLQELVLLVAPEHPFAGRKRASPQDLDGLELVALRPEFGMRQIVDRYFSELGIKSEVVLETTDVSSLRALVASGISAAIVPFDDSDRGAIQIPLSVPLNRPVGMITSATRTAMPAVQQFARFAREEMR